MCLYAHPDTFQTYIAASPSLFLSPEKLAESEAAFRSAIKKNPARLRLLVTLGELEGPSPAATETKPVGGPGDDPRGHSSRG
jgi:predicted alpha/beta superfamily hydrolase